MTDCGAERLAQAIVKQSCHDWKKAVKRLNKVPDCENSDKTRRECERFFRSPFFYNLTGMDAKDFLVLLRRTL